MARKGFIDSKTARTNVLEYLNKHKSSKIIDEASIPDIGPDLALNMFGKIYGGDPETGIVPGARPMSNDEKIQITYNMARDLLKQNGHDPDLADKWFLKWYGKSFK